MINLHESIEPGWDRTGDPWICSQTCSPVIDVSHHEESFKTFSKQDEFEKHNGSHAICKGYILLLYEKYVKLQGRLFLYI